MPWSSVEKRRAYVLANMDKQRAYRRKYNSKPETKAKERAAYLANRVERIAATRAWMTRNPDRVLAAKQKRKGRKRRPRAKTAAFKARRKASKKRYEAKHPELVRIRRRNAKLRRSGVLGSHTVADLKAIWARQRHKCAVPECVHPIAASGPTIYHIDHIQPLSKGGSNWPDNIQLLCSIHNVAKSDLDPYEWAQRVTGRLFPT